MNPQILNSSLEDHQIDTNPSIYQQGVSYAQFLLSKKKKGENPRSFQGEQLLYLAK